MKRWKVIFGGLVLFHLLLLVATRFTAWPEMLFWPYLLLKGWLPYRDIGIVHSPLLVLVLAGYYAVAGIGILQQQIFSWILAIFIDVIVYLVLRKLFNAKTALVAIFFYVLFQVFYDGNGIWFDHALSIFPITIYYSLEKKKYFIGGLLWFLAFLTKQTAFWLLLPIFISFISVKSKKDFIMYFAKGVFLVAGVFLIIVFAVNLPNDLIDWTVKFGAGTFPTVARRLTSLRLLFAALLPYAIFIPLFFSKQKKVFSLFVWSVAGALGTFPRFELFHFQPALPFLAAAYATSLRKANWLTWMIISVITLFVVRGLARNLFKPTRFYEDRDKIVVQVVDNLTSDDENIFVTNYWDNLYPLTRTLPATKPFIPQLTQYITPDWDESLAADLLAVRPKVVVRGRYTGTGDPFRFEKINNFIDNNYQEVEEINGIQILRLTR